MEHRRLDADAWLLVGEASGEVDDDLEAAAVEEGAWFPKVGQCPEEGVGVRVERHADMMDFRLLVVFQQLFKLAGEFARDAALFLEGGEALCGPRGGLGVDEGLQAVQAG